MVCSSSVFSSAPDFVSRSVGTLFYVFGIDYGRLWRQFFVGKTTATSSTMMSERKMTMKRKCRPQPTKHKHPPLLLVPSLLFSSGYIGKTDCIHSTTVYTEQYSIKRRSRGMSYQVHVVPPRMSSSSCKNEEEEELSQTTTSRAPATQQQWLCDVCQQVTFVDFEEACRHEEACTGPSSVHSDDSRSNEKGNADEQHSTTTVKTTTTASQKASIASQTSTRSTSSTTSVKPSAASIVSKWTKPPAHKTTKKKTLTCRKHQNIQSASSSYPKTTQPAQELPVQTLITRRGVSPDPPPSNTSQSKHKPKPATTKHVHSFFAPRSSTKSRGGTTRTDQRPDQRTRTKSRETVMVHTIDEEEDPTLPKRKDTQKKTSSTKPAAASSKKRKSGQDNNNNSDNNKNTQLLAGIFQNKSMQQLMAEQRQAEFQAQCRLQRQRDLKRQERKLAAAAAGSSTLQTSTTNTTAASTTTRAVLPAHCRLPRAPRFPVPAHVGVSEEEVESHKRPAPSPPLLVPDRLELVKSIPPPTLAPIEVPRHLDRLDASTTPRDLLQEALVETLVPPSRHRHEPSTVSTSISQQQDQQQLLWTQIYGHATNINHLVGASTLEAAGKLQEWIQDWCQNRQQALDRMKERQAKLKHKKKKTKANKKKNTTSRVIMYKEDSEEEGWDEEEDLLPNLYLLTGPPASGKTGLVHAAAQKCQCSVVEINTTLVRSGAALKHSIQEATQSCSTLHMFQKQKKQAPSYFATSQQQQQEQLQDTDDEKDENSPLDTPPVTAKPTASLTVILIDEVDLIYDTEGDSGFWAALAAVAKNARCPILLTANSIPSAMLSSSKMRYCHLELKRPSPIDCASKIWQVCQEQGIGLKDTLDKSTSNSSIPEQLSWIATVGHCDLRRILTQLQLFASSSRKSSDQDKKKARQNVAVEEDAPVSVLPPPALYYRGTTLMPPMVHSLVPNRIPFDRYSILTLHGTGFASLGESISVRLDETEEPLAAKVVSNDRILILCPPCGEYSNHSARRVQRLSIVSSRFGERSLSQVREAVLFDNARLPGLRPFFIEYLVPDEEDEDEEMDDDSEEQEFEGTSAHTKETSTKSASTLPTRAEGLAFWNEILVQDKALQAFMHAPPVDFTIVSRSDSDSKVLQALENMADAYEYSSDAALLEDGRGGIPYLAGACRGFGFDLTEEGDGFANNGKLRLNENSRSPNEERLYNMGWQDNCFFHGAADTYMTHPATAQERQAIRATMHTARGELNPSPDVMVPFDKDEENSTDLEDIVRRECRVSEEDMFMPRQDSSSWLAALPEILRCRNPYAPKYSYTSIELFESHRRQRADWFQHCLTSMFDSNPQFSRAGSRNLCRDLLMLNGAVSSTILTDFLPTLRYMATVEQSLDILHHQAGQETDTSQRTSGRSTRRQTRALRRHYFDTISKKLALDSVLQSTSQFCQSMASDVLHYNPPLLAT